MTLEQTAIYERRIAAAEELSKPIDYSVAPVFRENTRLTDAQKEDYKKKIAASEELTKNVQTEEPAQQSPTPIESVPEKKNDVTTYTKEQEPSQSINTETNPTVDKVPARPETVQNETINVVRDYDWTYSRNKQSNSEEVPFVKIKEFKLAGNSYITSLMTSALLFPDIVSSAAQLVPKSFSEKIESSFKDNKFAEFIQSNTPNLVGKIVDNAKSFANWATDQVKSIDKTAESWAQYNNDKTGNGQDLINKYAYLYIRKPTGTSYKFPYFDNSFFNISNSFEDVNSSTSGTAYQEAFKNLAQTVEKAANLLNFASMTEPGMYIQRPQFYKFGDSTYVCSVEFYLFNTINENAYLKNLKLITKLVVQNTPHRFNRLLVDPPCVYELVVPGRGFYPYTYISELKVDFEGTRRIIKANGKDIIVPDAFKVKIVFNSLTAEVNNFMIPEIGTAGIDVSKRYGIAQVFENPPDMTSKEATNSSATTPTNGVTPINPQAIPPPVIAGTNALGNSSKPPMTMGAFSSRMF